MMDPDAPAPAAADPGPPGWMVDAAEAAMNARLAHYGIGERFAPAAVRSLAEHAVRAARRAALDRRFGEPHGTAGSAAGARGADTAGSAARGEN